MSRRTILLLAGLYFVAAVAFSIFHVATNPFSSGLNTAAIGKGVGALLLFGGAGLLPILGWALYRFKPQYAMWPILSWAFLGIALAYFFEIGSETGARCENLDAREEPNFVRSQAELSRQ